MSNPVILSLPNGSKSRVFWQNQDGCVWFCNGWKEFRKYSKLDVPHLLVFRYEGNSCFNVIIFGSALEIEYPLSRDATKEEVEEIDKGSDFSVKFGEERRKRPREEVQEEEEEKPNKQKKKRACSYYSDAIYEFKSNPSEHCKGYFKKKLIMFHKKIMPAKFAKPYLHKEGSATLFVGHGRTWEVETKVNSHEQLVFSSGWRKFLWDNKLKLGDVCAFELLDSEPFLFKVTIYPLEENSNTLLFKGRKGVSDVPSSSLKTHVAPKARSSKPKDDIFIFIKSGVPVDVSILLGCALVGREICPSLCYVLGLVYP
ncbi:hypothetical protein VNO80_23813 [Phaseolus coccineus]|uniref:TF-B3 domain-containing protein n=1 Tax=Phaseolus coccineus TaxID=3886 RepID=A0AAN9MBP6_PHACN